jgi:isocitrate dehydrogenase (NAD+)
MGRKITLIPGDGIGPEVVNACVSVIKASGADIEFEKVDAGEIALKEYGTPMPDTLIETIEKNKIALKGPITTPIGSGYRSINVALRQKLDLYANLRPSKSFEGVQSRYKDIDLVIVRENTQGLYCGIEKIDEKRERAESINLITRDASEKIVRFAFDYAVKERRKKVTAVHKANILKATGGLFLEVAKNIAKEYPQIEFEDRIIDNMAMQLVIKPELYDVIVTTNLFGDILSDLCSGLVGGLGVVASGNIGKNTAIFEPVHGSAPKHAGKNKVNPTAEILAGIMMLKHIDEKEAAEKIAAATAQVIKEGKVITYDLKGNASTKEMAEEIIRKMDGA